MAGEHGGAQPAPERRRRSIPPRASEVPEAEDGGSAGARPKHPTPPPRPARPTRSAGSPGPSASAGPVPSAGHPALAKSAHRAPARPAPVAIPIVAGTAQLSPLAPANVGALTRTTHRLLVMQGLDPAEAANLTAYINGLPVGGHNWSLPEVNRLLFLRQMARRQGWEH
jgi:hypothetical protein